MHNEYTVTYVTTDSGRVIEVRKLTPVFLRFGRTTRGSYADRRLSRTRRSDARFAARRSTQVFDTAPAPDRHFAEFTPVSSRF